MMSANWGRVYDTNPQPDPGSRKSSSWRKAIRGRAKLAADMRRRAYTIVNSLDVASRP
jgi:hypothetical protein